MSAETGTLTAGQPAPDSTLPAKPPIAPKPNSTAPATVLQKLRLPNLAAARFFGKRAVRGASIWGVVFGAYIAASSLGYAKAYTSIASRVQIAASLGNNVGLKALFGTPYRIDTVGGFTAWRAQGIITIVGAVWAVLFATKTYRGEETSGRLELFLAGQTTARRLALNLLASFAAGLGAMFAIAAVITVAIGRMHSVDFSPGQSVFFALAIVASTAEFLAVGLLASQLMPIRSRAATASVSLFGAAFVLRMVADSVQSAHWLLYVSPLGWIELLRPLSPSVQPLWLLPIVAFVAAASAAGVFLAGHRDLGDGIFADKDTAHPHVALLNSPLGLAVRMTRASIAGWLAAIAVLSFLFGTIAKSASQAFNGSTAVQKISHNLTHQAQIVGSRTYLGIILFIVTLLIMAQVASSVSALREDEAEGYLDNLLVRPVGRVRVLGGRVGLMAATAIAAGLVAVAAMWAGAVSQHAGIAWHDMFLAGLNAASGPLLLLGIGIFTLGFAPRLAAAVGYGAIAWSFLLEMLGSAVNLNHWLLDTSMLHHVALAPAVAVNWRIVSTFVVLGAVLALLGGARFARRDLENE